MTQSKFQLVGSLLRPESLLHYKNQIEKREDITYPFYNDFKGYHQTEKTAISKIIEEQKENGIDILTDGEYSKSMWHLDFLWGLQGANRKIAEQGYLFQDHDGCAFETRKDIAIEITAPLSGKGHHFIDIFKEVKAQAGNHPVKTTVVSIAHAFTELLTFNTVIGENQVYHTPDELKEGLTKAYKEFLEEYKAAGGTTIQFDDCLWELFANDLTQTTISDEENIEAKKAQAQQFVDLNNAVADYGHEIGLTVWTHNCRGNYSSRHAFDGSYDAIAEKFLGEQHYDRFFLEWDDERAGSLDALKVLQNKDTEVVLGLLSSKKAELDDETRIYRLLEEAAEILPKERLFLSHQCGFASCDCGNELSQQQEWAKIAQGIDIANHFFSPSYKNQYVNVEVHA